MATTDLKLPDRSSGSERLSQDHPQQDLSSTFMWLKRTESEALESEHISDFPDDFAIDVSSTISNRSSRSGSSSKSNATYSQSPDYRITVLPYNNIRYLIDQIVPDKIEAQYVRHIFNSTELLHVPADIMTRYREYRETLNNMPPSDIIFDSLVQVMNLKTMNWIDNTRKLTYYSKQRFRNLLLPPEAGKYTLHPRVPDILYGYNVDAIDDIPPFRGDVPDYSYKKFKSTSDPEHNVYFPYLVVQTGTNMFAVENECIANGRVMLDMTWPVLDDQDAVYLVAITPRFVSILIMWKEEISESSNTNLSEDPMDIDKVRRPQYNVTFVESYDLQVISAFTYFQSTLGRIHLWAREDRLKRIIAGLQQWKTNGQPQHPFSPIGRNTVILGEEAEH
ncbi:hypothetical protein F4813DRAFT_351111 [Daldinia decipiens]|uniref:uncharacterized protein n=1 Tax=Daldinia decipiens TaxID=326647 RepID=UPI0020C36B01|nr:uncharacterized protein F4813DRAFT_351111 [Daldinia decipiens]KAI1660145.1 hypothetical protein F4813DRAFT_351111 [Daldinia decipiens]